MTADLGLVVIYPDLVDYSFIKYLKKMKVRTIEVPPKEYWALAVNGVLLEAGKVIVNSEAKETIAALRREG
ncbi:MAG: hypothetical protein ACK4TI_02070, partial [Nitrososphaerales archaeon]